MLRSSPLTAVFAASVVVLTAALSGCGQFSPAYMKPLSAQTRAQLAEKGMTEEQPILIRIFKAESELEVWKAKDNGRFYLFKTYPICSYSGGLGPKIQQGDRQAPEGFYLVSQEQLNPRSKYYLAFNMGFPNAFDRAHGRTGSNLMVHGDCTSSGCYSMTDAVMEEIYILAREALSNGQAAFQVQAYPFRMTAANLAAHKDDKWIDFWKNLKEGYDYFEISRLPPKVAVCEKRYLVNASFTGNVRPNPAGACPSYQRLPIPRAPAMQEASLKPKNSSNLSKPLGSVLGLTFGPSKNNYRAFTLGPATPGR
ncbi:MAG TPA: murein L,D-transpeptidase family protein [Methyloceanibacter sp.]|jgi:murein L,D-transpeptidase YafK|nr:murein L,D-transpeptidase family protein [Methyloceanibacter sp.]